MRKLIAAGLAGLLLTACATGTDTKTVIQQDPRLEALREVSINLEGDIPDLDIGEYVIDYEIREINDERYVVLTTSEYESLLLLLTEVSDYIRLQRNALRETNRLIDNAIRGEEVGGPDRDASGEVSLENQ